MIERENGLRQNERRRKLRQAPPSPSQSAWVERGSDNQAGRTHAARLSPSGDTLYVGSSLGGLWRGSPEGADWEPLGDNLYGGAHWVEVLASGAGGDVVFVATDGGLVHRSEDDGQTWDEPSGLDSPTAIRRLLKLEDDSDLLFMVTANSSGVQLRRSDDRGLSFTVVADLGSYSGDVWAPRDGGTALYLATTGGSLQRSDDLGDSWVEVGVIEAAGSRAELTGSEAGAPRLWAVVDGTTVWRSDDAGATWTNKGSPGDYWGALNASMTDPDLFAVGAVEMNVTSDGGDSYSKVNDWWAYYEDPTNVLHADIMGIEVQLDANGQEVWYINTDGGTYQSYDGLSTVENLSLRGLRISQYYDTLTSSANADHVAAGAQDQGYQTTNDTSQDDDLWEFAQEVSGDYGHMTSSDGSHDYVYSVYPGFVLVQVGEDNPWYAYLDFPTGESYVPWLPPIMADPTDPLAFFFPATRLYRYTFDPNRGTATYDRWSDQNFSSDGYEYVSTLAASPLDPQLMFAATSYGNAYASTDGGVTWAESPSLVADDNYYYGQAIVASNTSSELVYIGGSGYGVPAVYRSEDGGATFSAWGEGLPSTLVYSLCEARDGTGRMFAGTETAVYARGQNDDAWVDVTDNTAPITIYWSCESLTAESTIRFGTYGRGIWDLQLDTENTGCWPVQDYDGDGVNCDLDCDDHDSAVSPDVVEACDGIDVNCDPDDPVEVDQDGDGYLACDECDDTLAAVNPGGTEVCADGLDQDCSGADLPCDLGDDDDGRRCGCAAVGGSTTVWLGTFLALGLLVRRRRRG